jgi:aspartate/methionine/tyrosine aminotransferase
LLELPKVWAWHELWRAPLKTRDSSFSSAENPHLLQANSGFQLRRALTDEFLEVPKTIEYSPSQGIPSLIKRFAKYYQDNGIAVTEKNIIVTTGGVWKPCILPS